MIVTVLDERKAYCRIMERKDFEALSAKINNFNFRSENADDWQRFFDGAVKILDANDADLKTSAIHRYYQGLRSEREPFQATSRIAAPVEVRLSPMLAALTQQVEDFEPCFMTFAHWMNWGDKDVSGFFLSWLEKSSKDGEVPQLSEDMVLMAKLEFDDFPQSNWEEAKTFLVQSFASNSGRVRAAAGGAIARLYERTNLSPSDPLYKPIDLPPIEDMMIQIKTWEIEHPGIAGPFWSLMHYQFDSISSQTEGGFDVVRWMLDILEHRKGAEPEVECYNGIDFHAHEQMAGNPKAIRKLMSLGLIEIAAAAATELGKPIEGMQEILTDLASGDEELSSRICCWHLAYVYDYLHPEAVKKGFVKREDREDVHVYMVYNSQIPRAYAATVYPNKSPMDDSLAWIWIQKLVPKPEPANGTPEPKEWESMSGAQHVNFGGTGVVLYGDLAKKIWDRVWIKWPKSEGW